MKGTLDKAFGYKGNNMDLPVGDLEAALSFYQDTLGFKLVSRSDTPNKSAILERDQIQIGLAENGGDPAQDGCAFHVTNLDALLAEFKSHGLEKELSQISVEQRGGAAWRVFFVVAPDGLCYWLGEKS